MLKRSFLLTLLLATILPALAQPVIDQRYALTTTMGTPFTQEVDPLNPLFVLPATGLNRHWVYNLNYSGGPTCTLQHLTAVPAGVPAAFSPATIQFNQDDGAVVRQNFYTDTGSGIRELGTNLPTYYQLLSPPLLRLPYGLAYGARHTAVYSQASINTSTGTPNQVLTLRDTVAYVGAGTLQLNGRTFAEAVLMRHGQSISDGSSESLNLTYEFYVPGLGISPLILNVVDLGGSFMVVPQYFAGFTITEEEKPYQGCLTLAPNPATTELTITGLPNRPAKARILTPTGAEVTLPISAGKVRVESLPPGLYTLLVEGQAPMRFVKE